MSDPASVLVVSARSGALFAEMLEGAGHQARVAHDLDEALAVLRAGSIDLVVVDDARSMTAAAVCCALAKAGCACPRLVLVEPSDVGALLESHRQGASDHVIKPVIEADLLCRVALLVSPARAAERSERALSEHKFKTIFHNSPIGIELFDHDGFIIEANPRVCDMFGVIFEQVVGKFNLRHDPNYQDPEVWAALERNEEVRCEVEFDYSTVAYETTREGVHYYDVITTPVKHLSPLVGFILQIIDITDRKRVEAQLRHRRKMDAIGQLASGVAHDFNNMLGAMMASAEMLVDQLRSDSERENVYLILSAGERAASLTAKLLALGRRGAVVHRPVDVHHCIGETVALLRRTVKSGIVITTDFRASSFMMMGDETELQSALLNLGVNAGHAMPEGGGITFETELTKLDEAHCRASSFLLQPGMFIELRVRDEGIGISAEQLPRIFEPFFTTRGETTGTGLGLAAVYGMTQQHKGEVTVDSELGVGSCFILRLPLSDVPTPKSRARAELPASGGTVLVADDDPAMLMAASMMLENLGYNVLGAKDGVEALAQFRARQREIDAVILDMIMPRIGGAECCRTILEMDPTVPIVMSSGFTPQRLDMLGLGQAPPFVRKPYRAHELTEALAEAMRRRGNRPRGPAD